MNTYILHPKTYSAQTTSARASTETQKSTASPESEIAMNSSNKPVSVIVATPSRQDKVRMQVPLLLFHENYSIITVLHFDRRLSRKSTAAACAF